MRSSMMAMLALAALQPMVAMCDNGQVGKVAVDFARDTGKIRRELHSSGFGPQICSCPDQYIKDIKAMRFTASRTHDWALLNSAERVCDYYHIFPLMKLDATDPSNYVFGPTDYLLKRTREELGHDIFFRLGTSIEHSGRKVHFNAAIPTDFDKVAETFAGTIRHYNRGWANGYEWNIRYWEIWNEPDGVINMWCLPEGDLVDNGDKKEQHARDQKRQKLFATFFAKTVKRLKGEFPELKIGGPALCSMNVQYFRSLLDECRKVGTMPDFISWHHYTENPRDITNAISTGRKLLDEYGLKDCELIINEWHYFAHSDYGWGDLRSPDPKRRRICWEGPRSHNGIDSSCFNLVVLSQMQDSVLNQGYYYGCRNIGSWGYMNDASEKYKVFYGLKMFGEFVNKYQVKCATKTDAAKGIPAIAVLAAKTVDGKKRGLLIADYRTRSDSIEVKVDGIGEGAKVTAWLHDYMHDMVKVPATFSNGVIQLRKNDRESAAFLVEFE